MKTMYLEKVENKYVFNVSRIFWHILILIGTLAIIGGLFLYLYGIIPPAKKKIVKDPLPEKQVYPSAVTVSLNDLQLEETKKVEKKEQTPVETEEIQPKQIIDKTKKIEKGELEYLASLDTLIKLIPAKGHYDYKDRRLWDFYHDEKYRVWKDENDIQSKLDHAFSNTNAFTFMDKKKLVDGFISQLESFPVTKRTGIFDVFVSNVIDSVSRSINNINLAIKAIHKFPENDQINCLNQLLWFAKQHSSDGKFFIEFINKMIDKFDMPMRTYALSTIIVYNRYFNGHTSLQTEQTNLFLTLLPKIKQDLQVKALSKYYNVYFEKNAGREKTIAQIDQKYISDTSQIGAKYYSEVLQAESKYYEAKQKKSEYRSKALYGIAFGFVVVAFIAVILVFLSIQRSVRRIEEKLKTE